MKKEKIFDKNLAEDIFSIIKAADIKRADLLKRFDHIFSDRSLRIFIELMVDNGYLIGTSSVRGYFLISSEEDYNEAMHQLKSQATSLFKRANQLHKNFTSSEKDIQLTFLFNNTEISHG